MTDPPGTGRWWWGSENAWNVEKIPNDDENSCAKNLWKMRETCKDEKESDEASCAVLWVKCDKRFFDGKGIHRTLCSLPWTRSAVNVINVFWRERIHQTLCSLPWTRSAVNARNVFWRKRNSSDIMGCTMNSKSSLYEKVFWGKSDETSWAVTCIECEKRFLTKSIFNKHHGVYHELEVQ